VQIVQGIHPKIIHTNFAVVIATSPVPWIHTTSFCPMVWELCERIVCLL